MGRAERRLAMFVIGKAEPEARKAAGPISQPPTISELWPYRKPTAIGGAAL